MASVFKPHESEPPALTAVNAPSGASVCPYSLLPQQMIVASVLTAHVWSMPASIALKASHVGVSGSTVTVGSP